jgi:Alanine racemase, N-terminal domain
LRRDGVAASLCYALAPLPLIVPRPILATIHLGALRHNLARAREEARGRFLWAVVKANAYGHGLEPAMRAFGEADGLALLDLDEARRARVAGWRKPILLLEGCWEAGDLAVCSELDLTTVVHCGEQLEMIEHHRPARPVSVHLKLNTGMNRLGFRPQGAVQAYERLRGLPTIRELTLMMRFAPPGLSPLLSRSRSSRTSPPSGRSRAASPTRRRCFCSRKSAGTPCVPGLPCTAVRPMSIIRPRTSG